MKALGINLSQKRFKATFIAMKNMLMILKDFDDNQQDFDDDIFLLLISKKILMMMK